MFVAWLQLQVFHISSEATAYKSDETGRSSCSKMDFFLNVILKRLESVMQQIFQSSLLRNDRFIDDSIENGVLHQELIGLKHFQDPHH